MAELLRAAGQRAPAPAGAPQPGVGATAAAATVVGDVTIRDLQTLDELGAACEVFATVWARSDGDQILPVEILRALTHAGNYAAGAFSEERLVGAVVGFQGDHDGATILHSHIMGLVPDMRGRGLGYALKHHQRRWALARGIQTITWTFDPLVRANAYLNLTKLGATAREYLPDFYGSMTDQVNAGAGSDRLLVTWELRSKTATRSAAGSLAVPDESALLAGGAAVILDEGAAGEPIPTALPPAARTVLCRVPDDIMARRRNDPGLASAWRQAVRATLGAAIGDGFVATAVTGSGAYVMQREPILDDDPEGDQP